MGPRPQSEPSGRPLTTTRFSRPQGRRTARARRIGPPSRPRLNVEQSNMNTNDRDQATPDPGTPARQYPVTYDDASRRYGPGTHAARTRYNELTIPEHLPPPPPKLPPPPPSAPPSHAATPTG